MKPITFLYLRVFFLSGALYASLMYIANSVMRNNYTMGDFLFYYIAFGLIWSLILVTRHKNKLHELGIYDIKEALIKTHFAKEMQYTNSLNELYNKLLSDSFFSKQKIILSENQIQIITTMSMDSFGEKIVIKSQEQNRKIYILSSCSRIFAWVDYGRNYSNVLRLEQILS